jgi:putative flavoprotein involved in K+ transport
MAGDSLRGLGGREASFHTLVIGGGQAGLAAGYHLAKREVPFAILDENPRSGESWRKRWDSLRLFTPSQFNGLPGMPFPKPKNYLPSKNEVSDYLEEYVGHFSLPVQHQVKVKQLSRTENGYHLSTGTTDFLAENVVVATGPFQKPYTPSFASQLDSSVVQIHSSGYCNPQSVPGGSILVVGAGNSGAEISLELVKAGRKVWLSGRDVGRIPANGPLGKAFDGKLIWWIMSHVLNVKTPIGRKMRAGGSHQGTPLGRATRQELSQAGVELVPRVSGIQAGRPQLEDGRILSADGVLWATGFHPDYRWIDLPIFDEKGYPRHWRGVVKEAPGLYFIGLLFQTALTSPLLGGVGADAAYIAGEIASRAVN